MKQTTACLMFGGAREVEKEKEREGEREDQLTAGTGKEVVFILPVNMSMYFY